MHLSCVLPKTGEDLAFGLAGLSFQTLNISKNNVLAIEVVLLSFVIARRFSLCCCNQYGFIKETPGEFLLFLFR